MPDTKRTERTIFRRLLAAVGIVLLVRTAPGCGPPSPQEPLNILFLFADDQAYDAAHYAGNGVVQTPNLDRLASEGFTFTHAFNQGSWSGAVCVVSRAMLNSGRYIYRARDDLDRVPLWGEVLSQAGYRTFITGKWHNGDATVLRSFEEGRSIGAGMYETLGGTAGAGYRRPTADNNTWTASDTSLLGHWRPRVTDIVLQDTIKAISEPYVVEQHTSALYADRAIAFLDDFVEHDERPFFLYVAFNAPHDPRQSPNEYLDRYPVEAVPVPASFRSEHPFEQGERYTLRDEILAPFPRAEWAVQTHLREYYAIITHMDHEIGRILERLDHHGLAENTLVVFTSDHGLAVGRHGLMGKQNQYDHSIRVPLLFKGPGIPAGRSSEALVYLQSIYPTTLELAGIPVPATVEFSSVTPVLKGSADSVYGAIFGSYKQYQRMIRTRDSKLIVYPEVQQVQLFDLATDPDELRDLAQNPEYRASVEHLFETLEVLQQQVGDTLRLGSPDAYLK